MKLEQSLQKFWANRFLRLYPTFLVVSIFGFLVAWSMPLEADALRVGLVLPESERGAQVIAAAGFPSAWWPLFYFPNVTMLGIQAPVLWTTPIAFAPTAWSTNVELYYYALLSFGAASSPVTSRRFLLIALVLLALLPCLYLLHDIGVYRYGTWAPGFNVNKYLLFYKTFLGWTFFFAVGCFAYFLPKLQWPLPVRLGVLAMCLSFPFLYTDSVNLMIGLRIMFGVVVAVTLLSFSDDRGPSAIRLLGDMSYPLFLIHWPAAAVASWMTGLPKNGAVILLATVAISLVLSAAIVLLIERPVEQFRQRNRS